MKQHNQLKPRVFTAEIAFCGIFVLDVEDRSPAPSWARVWLPRSPTEHCAHQPRIVVREESWPSEGQPRAGMGHSTLADASGRPLAVVSVPVPEDAPQVINFDGIQETDLRADWGPSPTSLARMLDLNRGGAKHPLDKTRQAAHIPLPGGVLCGLLPVRPRGTGGETLLIADGALLRCTVLNRLAINFGGSKEFEIRPSENERDGVRVSFSNLPHASRDGEFLKHLKVLADGIAVEVGTLASKLRLEGPDVTPPSKPCPNGVVSARYYS